MTKKLTWRLGKMATPEEVLKLVNDKIITKEEARDILFNEKEETERDVKSLEDEIKFLREIVDKLSKSRTNTIDVIRSVQVPYYYNQPWYGGYATYCGTSGSIANSGSTGLCSGTGSTTLGGQACQTSATIQGNSNFSDIKTF